MTTGPSTSSARLRASSAVVAKPPLEVGMPPRRTISLDSNSKKRMAWVPLACSARAGAEPYRGGLEPLGLRALHLIRLRQLRILAGEHLGEVHHDLGLLPGRVVLHLAVDHVHAAPVGDRLDDLLGEEDLIGVGREDLLGDVDLGGVQRPRPDAAEEEGGAKLRLAALNVLDVPVWAVEGKDP